MNPYNINPPTTAAGTQARATQPEPNPLDESLLLNAEYVDILEEMAANIYANTRDSLPPPPMPCPVPRPVSPVGQLQYMEALRQQLENNIVMMATNAQHLADMERQLAASGQALWRLAAAHGVNAGDGEKARRMDASVFADRDPRLQLMPQENEALGNR